MKKTKENLDEYEINVKACREIGDDKKTGKKLFEVMYEEVVMDRKFEMEVSQLKKCKSYVELKKDKMYKVNAEEFNIPNAYISNGQARASIQKYYRITRVIEEIKQIGKNEKPQ